MTDDEIKAFLKEKSSGRFKTQGDAVIIGLDVIPEEHQDDVIAWVESNGGTLERLIRGPLRQRLTPPAPTLGPLSLIIPLSALS